MPAAFLCVAFCVVGVVELPFRQQGLARLRPASCSNEFAQFFNLTGTSMIRLLAPFAAVILFTACATPAPDPAATASLMPTKGNNASGEVKFTQKGGKVWVTGEIGRAHVRTPVTA